MKMESIIKKLKWPSRLFLFALLYLFVGSWVKNHQQKLNEAVVRGSFQDFDIQKYEQFNSAKNFYKYVAYFPWINVRNPEEIALMRWSYVKCDFSCILSWDPDDQFAQDFSTFLEKTELLNKVKSRTETIEALYSAVRYPNWELDRTIRYSDVSKCINQSTQNMFDKTYILLNTKDTLSFLDPRYKDTFLLTGEMKSEHLEVLNQLDSQAGSFYRVSEHEELFLNAELESFVLEHRMAFQTFGYIGPARIFENTGKRLGIHPDGWFQE